MNKFGTGRGQPLPAFPLSSDVWNLSSDVVDIGGVSGTTTLAMQMSFDDAINTSMDGGQISTVYSTYLAELDSQNQWVNASTLTSKGAAVTPAMQGYAGSLSAFLQEYEVTDKIPLSQLAGSWGVAVSPGGVGTSWAIVNNLNSGGSQFAVVPEPSTCVLLGAGVVGLLVYRVRRKARRIALVA